MGTWHGQRPGSDAASGAAVAGFPRRSGFNVASGFLINRGRRFAAPRPGPAGGFGNPSQFATAEPEAWIAEPAQELPFPVPGPARQEVEHHPGALALAPILLGHGDSRLLV